MIYILPHYEYPALIIYEYTAPNISKPSERSLPSLPVLLPHAAELLPLPAPLAPDQSLLVISGSGEIWGSGETWEIDGNR